MTDPTDPPPPAEVPRRFRYAIALLAGLVVVALSVLLWVVWGPLHDGSVERHRLACQVQELGGKPIGDVHCPPAPTPKTTPSHHAANPTPHLTPAPGGTTTLVVRPPRTGPASNPRATSQPSSHPHATHSSHPPSSHPPTPLACATVGPVATCVGTLPPVLHPWRNA